MARYHITIVRPRDYLHSSCFHEIANGVCDGLVDCGHTVTFTENHIDPEATNIIFGAHLYTAEEALSLPASAVVYNLEQLGISWTPPWYMRLGALTQIWDYSPLNLEKWSKFPSFSAPRLVEIGYDPHHRPIRSAPVQDIDVLFYGSPTDRRDRALEALTAAGVGVHNCFGLYGVERDCLIARSKIVLNLHAADTRIFEAVRVAHLLANAKAVVAEESVDFGRLADAVAACKYEDIVAVCQRLLADDSERRELEQRGFQRFSECSQAQILAEVLGEEAATTEPNQAASSSPS